MEGTEMIQNSDKNQMETDETVTVAVSAEITQDVDRTLYDAEEFLSNFAGLKDENEQLKQANLELEAQLEKARQDIQQLQIEKQELENELLAEREENKNTIWELRTRFQKAQEERLQWKEKYLDACMRAPQQPTDLINGPMKTKKRKSDNSVESLVLGSTPIDTAQPAEENNGLSEQYAEQEDLVIFLESSSNCDNVKEINVPLAFDEPLESPSQPNNNTKESNENTPIGNDSEIKRCEETESTITTVNNGQGEHVPDANSNFIQLFQTEKKIETSEVQHPDIGSTNDSLCETSYGSQVESMVSSSCMEDIPQSFTVSHNAVLDFLMNGDDNMESGNVDMSQFKDLIRFPKEVKKKKKKFRFVKEDKISRDNDIKNKNNVISNNELLIKKLIKKHGNISPVVNITKIILSEKLQNMLIGTQPQVTESPVKDISVRSVQGKTKVLSERKPSLRKIPRKDYLQLHSGPLLVAPTDSPVRVAEPSSPEYDATEEGLHNKKTSSKKITAGKRKLESEFQSGDIATIVKCAQCFGLFIEGTVFESHKKYCSQGRWKFCTYCPYRTVHDAKLLQHMNTHQVY